jgi:hypothetical protein
LEQKTAVGFDTSMAGRPTLLHLRLLFQLATQLANEKAPAAEAMQQSIPMLTTFSHSRGYRTDLQISWLRLAVHAIALSSWRSRR